MKGKGMSCRFYGWWLLLNHVDKKDKQKWGSGKHGNWQGGGNVHM